jgi:branched-chain amino acid transport system substrate-binding protein
MKSITRRAVLAACTTLAAAGLPLAAAADTVKVGVIGTFSGAFARFGEQMKFGIEAFQAHNGATVAGHKIEVVYRDVGGVDPARARQLVEELILREKVQVIGGFVLTPNALAAAEVLNEAKVPAIVFNAATSVIPRRSPYFVRTSFTLAQNTVPLAQWAAKNGVKRAMTMVFDYGPGYDGEDAFVRTFKAEGGEIMESIRVPIATTDFSPYFERVLARKPEALFMFSPGGPPAIGMMNTWTSRLKPAGIRLLATNETQEIDLPKIGPGALDVISASHYTETVDNPLNQQLRKTLVEKFGRDTTPDTELVSAYDGMRLVYAAVQKFGPKFTGDQAVGLWKGMKFDSPRGPVMIDPDTRDIVQNIYVRRVQQQGGRLVNVNIATIPMVKDPWKEWNPETKPGAK